MLALFRDYDVAWPRSTHDAMGWFEVVNVGLSITAPECFIGNKYSFYYYYIFEMALPFVAVSASGHLTADEHASLMQTWQEGCECTQLA
jgi:hypothetical protein